ncbi:hypothetical protein OE88DRAFT_59659 [Heliocybe sulcata]|uniref:Uncharacterized protein n=1 Tax=Heliocybe sulcata TaxID=5364 RepID=A0A5C3NHG1_9AGAM|nr:hypothetical protein OE88DRAFT_59659 [Heliocybe sulcata]
MPGPLAHTRSLSKWLKFSSSNTETKKSSDAGHSDFGVLDEKAAQAHQYSVRPGLAIHSHSLPAREAPRAPRRSARDIHSFSDGSLYNTNDPRHAAYTYYPARPTALSDIGHITATYSPTNIPPSIISSSPSPPPSSSSPSSAHPYSKSSNPLPNPVPDPLPTYQNLPSSYSNRSNSHVSGPSSPNVHTPPSQITLPNTAILSQKPLPPLPSPPPLTPAWDNDSSVGHGYAFTDAGHYSAVTAPLPEIGHHYITSAWTDAGHDTDDFRPYDDLDKPQPTFANTPASSSSTLSVPNPRRRSIFGRKAHSDIGHGHHPSSTSQSAGSQLGDTHVPASATESACPPSFSRHFFLASSSNQTDPSSSQHRPRKLRKQPRSASASRIDLPDITVSDCGHASSSMDVTNVRPASLVVSPMGPPMMSLGKAPGYQDKRPPPLAIPSGKENTRSKQESKPRKPSLIRRWTLNRAAASSSSASASASNEGSVSSAQDASVSTPVTTPDSGEMEFRWSGQAVSESGHGYGKWFTGKRARDSVLSMSESTVASPRASTSVSAFSGETATTRGSGGIAGQGAQMVGGRRVSRKLTKRRRPSVGQGQATPITPATPATSTTVFVTSPTSIDASTADVRSPSSTSLGHGWTSGGESRGRDNASSHSKRRKLKKRSRSRRPAVSSP